MTYTTTEYNRAREKAKKLHRELEKLENGDEYDAEIEERMASLVDELRGLNLLIKSYMEERKELESKSQMIPQPAIGPCGK